MTLPRWWAVSASLALALALAWGLLQAREASRLDAELAHQRAERLEAVARADGWETQWAETVPDLLASRAEKDSMIARLREEIQLAGAHAVASTTVETVTRIDTVFVADAVDAMHVRFEINKAPFSGMATFYPPNKLGLDLHARVQTELIGTLAPDGRLLVTARTPDPGVSLAVKAFAWDPPEPETPRRWPWVLGSFAAGVLAWELIR